MDNEKVRIRLQSGLNVDLSAKVHDTVYCNFSDSKDYCFEHIMNAGYYFPQIVQFIMIINSIFMGHDSFKDILICGVFSSVFYTVIWYVFRMYMLPGIAFLSCLIGAYIFKLHLHFIVYAIVALFKAGNWKIILYCMVIGLITRFIRSILVVALSTVKYNDEAAVYVSNLRN